MNSSPSAGVIGARSSWILDASALLALVLTEPGGDKVRAALDEGGIVCSVNLAEALSKLLDFGWSLESANQTLANYEYAVVDMDSNDALVIAELRPLTRSKGLSLGDRACLAVARRLGLPALTADRHWAGLDVGAEIVLCR